jgi:mannosyltransferase OCH1-like enzyme
MSAASSTAIGAVLGAVVGLLVFGCLWTLQLRTPAPQPVSDPAGAVRIVHQIWFQGEDAIPAKFLPYRRSCSAKNPAWTIVLHDDASLQKACAAVDAEDPSVGLLDLYHRSDTMHERIDMGRLAALWRQGGVSVDMDMICMRGLDDILRRVPLDSMGVSGVQSGPLRTAWYASRAGRLGQLFFVANNASWVLPTARSPLLLDLIRTLAAGARRSYAEQPLCSPTRRVMSTWGPTPCSAALVDVWEKLTIFRQPSFERVASSPSHCDDGETVLCHLYELSWLEEISWAKKYNIYFLLLGLCSAYAGAPALFDVTFLTMLGAMLGATLGAVLS